MYVIKRDGKRAPVQFDKITARISKLCYGLSDKVQSVVVAQKVRRAVPPLAAVPFAPAGLKCPRALARALR